MNTQTKYIVYNPQVVEQFKKTGKTASKVKPLFTDVLSVAKTYQKNNVGFGIYIRKNIYQSKILDIVEFCSYVELLKEDPKPIITKKRGRPRKIRDEKLLLDNGK